MGTLRRRLSLRKKRSYSFTGYDKEAPERGGARGGGTLPRQTSVDNKSVTLRLVSPAKSDSHLDVQDGGHGGDAISIGSGNTFMSDQSTLIIETTEKDKSHKYYLIPHTVARSGLNKLNIKGNKFHMFNNHMFSASHVAGGTACQACGMLIPRKFGRQGYVCRDCMMVVHKPCHCRLSTELTCPKASFPQLEMIHLEPQTETIDEEDIADEENKSMKVKRKESSKEKKSKKEAAKEEPPAVAVPAEMTNGKKVADAAADERVIL
ncbi:PREDICTED: uncharacterized protein LOC106812296 [Priapulus caudatus]|uniref:Uncharacterized protein LOC106812296 n=1 Tax=Priapulus caudatus TaxID=37621 RepID=A0ABM1EHE9_PRICU|nr:PREDICTED: uncharacterized protein LOC106812296 [Priapulus caudatus]